MLSENVACFTIREALMDRNAEAILRRDRVAMQGPARVLVRHFLNVPVTRRAEYYLVQADTKYGPKEIEDLARQLGIHER